MKKIFYIIPATLLIVLNSCTNQEPGNWFPEAADYSGQFVVQVYNDTDKYRISNYNPEAPIYFYNTAANNTSELWFSTEGHDPAVRVKVAISGDPTNFTTPNQSYEAANENIYLDYDPIADTPTAAGITISETRDKARAVIDVAKILHNEATTPGGNIADSIYVKINFYAATLDYESYEKPQNQWSDPLVPEYEWEFKRITHDPAKDWVCVFAGFRWTGYPEDMDIYE